jgi:hypothetical protein
MRTRVCLCPGTLSRQCNSTNMSYISNSEWHDFTRFKLGDSTLKLQSLIICIYHSHWPRSWNSSKPLSWIPNIKNLPEFISQPHQTKPKVLLLLCKGTALYGSAISPVTCTPESHSCVRLLGNHEKSEDPWSSVRFPFLQFSLFLFCFASPFIPAIGFAIFLSLLLFSEHNYLSDFHLDLLYLPSSSCSPLEAVSLSSCWG